MPILLAALAFFLSGFAALVYQVVWQRMLVLPIGADVYSTTVIVGAFMAGLGAGSLAGGHVADRLSRAQCLWLFAAAEAAVGLFGAASRYLFYDWMYLTLGGLALSPLAVAIVVFGALAWPTFWMGMSLPLLARAVTSTLAGAPARIGVLYGLNTLGAATGAFATTWILFPSAGLAGSLWIAASLNALAAAAALGLTRRRAAAVPEARASAASTERGAPAPEPPPWGFRTWAVLYGIAGFQALSLEIVWFRLLGVMVKSSAFTFGTLLAIYLAGLGLGAAIGSAMLRRVRRPALSFLLLQAFVALYAGGAILALTSGLGTAPALSALLAYFASYEPFDAAAAAANFFGNESARDRAQFVRLYLLMPAILIGPATVAMGASFPLIQRIVVSDLAHIGRLVGTVMLANIAGSTLGAVLTGWIALTYLGSAGSLRMLAVTGGMFLALAVLSLPRRGVTPVLAAGAGLAGVILATALPGGARLWARLHGTVPQRLVVGEDASGVSALKADGRSAVVFVNGIGQSWIPYGDIHTVLGALPAFVHPQPREAALIGLGSGDTVHAVAGRQELTRITCIEIIRPQLTTLAEWHRRTQYGGLAALLSDPRIEHVAGDGRAYLMNAGRTFDIIEADALRPASAYSGNLYSTGYFTLVRSRLSPGGLAVSWAPTPRIVDTFVQVFPHALNFGDILIGSTAPIEFDAAKVRARLASRAVQDHYLRAGVNINALLARYLDTPPQVLSGADTAPTEGLNEDLFPRDEFGVRYRGAGGR
ncbi:MAG TPA: fused MFS/spermidine synthase [Vicinamibacterales bacterium]|nr:fused MFS/spermidine synthase [Vicinamibacterales bacterium]